MLGAASQGQVVRCQCLECKSACVCVCVCVCVLSAVLELVVIEVVNCGSVCVS